MESKKSGHIYRILQHQKGNIYQCTDIFNSVPAILAPSVRGDFPDDVKVTRVKNYERQVRYKNRQFYEKRFFYAEPELLEIFTFPVDSGDPKIALEEPYTVMITRDTAQRYFDKENPVNKSSILYSA